MEQEAGRTVSESFKLLLRLLSAGGLGESICAANTNVDWNPLIQLALEQSVFLVTANSILENPTIMPDAELKQFFLEQVRHSAYKNMLHRQRIMQLLREMEEHGIQAVLLKGYEVAKCYHMPECRMSVDTDVLVPREQELAAFSFLKGKGFRLEPRGKVGHHSVGRHEKYGVVELHVKLYDEIIQDIWFHGMEERFFFCEALRRVEDGDETYFALGHTDNLLFLMLHLVKHFIISGASLGMMLDIALYFRTYSSQIDTTRIWRILDALHYRMLISTVLQVFVQYGSFRETDFPGMCSVPAKLVDHLLCDLEQGGRMGIKDKNQRIDCSFEYTRRLILKEKNMLQYIWYLLKWRIKTGIKYVLPSREMLEIMHPIVIDKPNLHVWFRLYQFFVFPIAQISTGFLKKEIRTNNSNISLISKKRLELFSELDML